MECICMRLAHRLAGEELASVGRRYWRPGLFWLFVLEMVELPLSWGKVHGGTKVQWIGYDLDIGALKRFIS